MGTPSYMAPELAGNARRWDRPPTSTPCAHPLRVPDRSTALPRRNGSRHAAPVSEPPRRVSSALTCRESWKRSACSAWKRIRRNARPAPRIGRQTRGLPRRPGPLVQVRRDAGHAAQTSHAFLGESAGLPAAFSGLILLAFAIGFKSWVSPPLPAVQRNLYAVCVGINDYSRLNGYAFNDLRFAQIRRGGNGEGPEPAAWNSPVPQQPRGSDSRTSGNGENDPRGVAAGRSQCQTRRLVDLFLSGHGHAREVDGDFEPGSLFFHASTQTDTPRRC